MKARLFLAILLSSVTLLSGCAAQTTGSVSGTGLSETAVSSYEPEPESETAAPNWVSPSNFTPPPTGTASSATSLSPFRKKALAGVYAEDYFSEVESLIEQYGFYYENAVWGTMGFIRGDLIDFEGDGTPELVCIYRTGFWPNIRIYRYADGKAALLTDEQAGGSVFGEESPEISFADIEGTPCILIQNSNRGETERISILTVEDGALQTVSLTSDVEGSPEASNVRYANCCIDGAGVSEEEYSAVKQAFFEDGKTVDWAHIGEGGEIRAYEIGDARTFIESLADDAGIGEDETKGLTRAICPYFDYVYFTRELPVTVPGEGGSEKLLSLSAYETDYIDYGPDGPSAVSPVVLDFDGDGEPEELTLDVSDDFPETEYDMYNKPIRINMRIGDSEQVFESTWNDGIDLYIVDFSKNDPYLDICIFRSGTDIDGYYEFYRYDGVTLDYYSGIGVQDDVFSYDGAGMAYFVSLTDWFDPDTGKALDAPVIMALNCESLESEVFSS